MSDMSFTQAKELVERWEVLEISLEKLSKDLDTKINQIDSKSVLRPTVSRQEKLLNYLLPVLFFIIGLLSGILFF